MGSPTDYMTGKQTKQKKKLELEDVSGKTSTLKHRQKNGWKIQINKEHKRYRLYDGKV